MVGFIEEFGILLLIVVLISFLIKVMKQPIIIGYVLSGLIFSFFLSKEYPLNYELIIVMSELGIMFLLFLMGLEFDLKNLRYLGKDILIAIIPQSIIFFTMPFFIAGFFGFGIMERVYIGILFMFSSTLLVAKWLEDKKETNALHGKIILGTLIVQDVLAIIALTILSVIKEKSWIAIAISPLKGLLLVLIAVVLAKFVLNRLLKIASRYPELLFIFGLGICFLFIQIAAALSYSTTIGAFIGGITLANTIYKNEVASRLRPLIIFFNMLFFVGLGFQMTFNFTAPYFLLIMMLIILSICIKPVVIYISMRMRKYDSKTSFLCCLYLSQISEFGLIIVSAGIIAGAISQPLSSLAIIVVITTMILSSYLIKYDKKIFKQAEPYLAKLEKYFATKKVNEVTIDVQSHFLFFGYYDLSSEILTKIRQLGKNILVVENDPENIEILKKEGIPYLYNSASNPEFFETISLHSVELAVSSLLDSDENKLIIKHIKESNPRATVIVTAKSVRDSLDLYNHRADYVIYPSYINEQHVSVLIEEYTSDINKVITKKIEDLDKFKERDLKRSEANKVRTKFWDLDKFYQFLTEQQRKKGKPEEIALLPPKVR